MSAKETQKRSSVETTHASSKKLKTDTTPTQITKQKVFQYGNYNRYYGYRNANKEKDKRIDVFKREWFEGKSCLDIGCNVGHLTLWIAKYFKVGKMKGVDIDCHLIQAAKNNIAHYTLDDNENVENNDNEQSNNCEKPGVKSCGNSDITKAETSSHDGSCINPSSFETESDKIKNNDINEKETLEKSSSPNESKPSSEKCIKDINMDDEFPNNVTFVTENIVPASDNVLKYTKPQYDVIMCLSVTKWIQLNEGDDGLKRLFKKIYKLLNEGGMFILEPQPFPGYKRRKNLTPIIRRNFDNMKLYPAKFIDYLLSDEVGFKSAEPIETTNHDKEGFQRPIYILKK